MSESEQTVWHRPDPDADDHTVQLNLKDTERASVMPLWFMVFGGTVPIGNLLFGVVIEWVGPRLVLGFGAAFALFLAWWGDCAARQDLLFDYRDYLRARGLGPTTVRWRTTVVRAFLGFVRRLGRGLGPGPRGGLRHDEDRPVRIGQAVVDP